MDARPTSAWRRRLLPFGPYFTLFALAVGSLAAAAAIASAHTWSPRPNDLVGLILLAAAFTVARLIAIEVDTRRGTLRITVPEMPLVVGLLLIPGPVVVAAYLLVMLVARLLRRDNWTKFVINLAGATLLVVMTDLTAGFLDRHGMVDAPDWAVLLVGFLVGQGVYSAVGLVAIQLLARPNFAAAARPMAHSYVAGVLSAIVGLVGALVVVHVDWGWVLAGLLALAMLALFRTYYGVVREQRDLGLLSRISLVVAGTGRYEPEADTTDAAPDVWLPAAELIREQLNATRVVLHREAFPDQGLRTVVAGQPLPATASHDDLSILHSEVLAGDPTGGVQHVNIEHAPSSARRELENRGAREALVVPLRGAHQLLGILEVHDLQNRLRGFSAADVRLVGTLASHLATAMDNRRLLARLRHDAYHDLLTGLRNRLGFLEAAAELLANDRAAAVVVLDLDVLNSVNDALGHVWGDRIVLAAGHRLREALGDGVLAARLEADTFAVLLPDVDVDQATETAELLRAALSEHYPVEKLAVECTALAGIAMTTVEPTNEVDVLLQRADVALHAARSGDAKVRTYLPSMGQIFLRRFQLVTQFRGALDSGQIELHYQPKVALANKQVIGVEALVRWNHPEFGALDPEEWVSAVETTGLVDALTDFVMDRALLRCRRWLDQGMRLSVAVNLSVRNLDDGEFPQRVTQALAAHQIPPHLLTFELTESAVMRDPERALPVLRQLHEAGVGLAVDDFGTGYSSLSYLRRLPVDEVKIDKSFVLGMGSDLSDLAVVRAIVDLGHSLSLSVVAEGVEEEAVRHQLTEMGCDVAQGYLFSRPLGERRFEAWLLARTVLMPGMHPEETVPILVR
ncbi:MAG TPA: EAL domain-containing protein [Pseudonocardiaceae bacterium]